MAMTPWAEWPQEVKNALEQVRAWKDESIDPEGPQTPCKVLVRLFIDKVYESRDGDLVELVKHLTVSGSAPDFDRINHKRNIERAIFGTYKNNGKDTGTKIKEPVFRACNNSVQSKRAHFAIYTAVEALLGLGEGYNYGLIRQGGKIGFNTYPQSNRQGQSRRVVDVALIYPTYEAEDQIGLKLTPEQEHDLRVLLDDHSFNIQTWSNPVIDPEILERMLEDEDYMFEKIIAWSQDQDLFREEVWVNWVFNCHYKGSAEAEYDLKDVLWPPQG